MKLKEIKDGMKILCKTEEEAKELIKWAYKCGFTWDNITNENETYWDKDKGHEITYFMKEHYNNILWSESIEDSNMEFSDLIIPEETDIEELNTSKEKEFEELTVSEILTFLNDIFNNTDPEINKIFNLKECTTRIEILEMLKRYKQWKSEHSSTPDEYPEIEWYYYCSEYRGEIFEDNYTSSEEDAIKWCEQKTLEYSDRDLEFKYDKVCRVKENK